MLTSVFVLPHLIFSFTKNILILKNKIKKEKSSVYLTGNFKHI